MGEKTVLSRRRMLVLGSGAAVGGLAGCTDDNGTGDGETSDEGSDEDDESGDDGGTGDDESGDDDDNGDGDDGDTGDGESSDDDDNGDGDDDDNGDGEHALTTYTNDKYGYELQVPDGWATNETNWAEIYLYGDGVEELVLSTYQYSPESTLDDIADEAIRNSQSYPEFEVVGQSNTTIESGEEGRIIEWRYSPAFVNVRYHTKFLIVISDGGIVYTVEMGTDENAYDEAFDAFVEAVLTSFTVVEPPETAGSDGGVTQLRTGGTVLPTERPQRLANRRRSWEGVENPRTRARLGASVV